MMFTLVLLATLLPWTFAFPNQQFVSHVVEEVRRFSGNEKPNILFVIDESTDAKAYFVENEEDAPMDLPNLRVCTSTLCLLLFLLVSCSFLLVKYSVFV